MSLTSFINEKLQINKDYVEPYAEHPKDKNELVDILRKRLEDQSNTSEKNPINLNDIDVSNITDLSNVFWRVDHLHPKYIDISNWNVSNVLDFSNMFNECSTLHSIGDIGGWDVSSGQNFYNMFNECKMLKNIGDLSNWQMNNAVNIISMFENCKRLTDIGDVGQWDVSSVKNFNFIFKGCEKLKPMNLDNWKINNKVTGQNIRMFFSGTSGWKMPVWYSEVRKR